jgi:FlaA1/EpsC-like NDP-sugar epimerase
MEIRFEKLRTDLMKRTRIIRRTYRVLHEQLAARLIALPRLAKFWIAMTLDLIALCVGGLIRTWVVTPDRLALANLTDVSVVFGPALAVVPCLWVGRCYDTVVRFANVYSMLRVLKGVVLGYGLIIVASLIFHAWEGGGKSLIVGPLIAAALLTSWRLAAAQFLRVKSGGARSPARPVLIYGAGEAGIQLATALMNNRFYRPVAFVDDRPDLSGRLVQGLSVYPPKALASLKESSAVEQVLLAVPSASRKRRREILEDVQQLGYKVLVMPMLDELVSGERRVDDLREVQIEDLLGRDPVPPVEELMNRYIRGCSVMVSGAGGSIGSEICRQALKQGARKLVLLEQSEFALYSIDRELRATAPSVHCEIVPVLGSVTDRAQMLRVLREQKVETIYHAAAYKHVPLLESNVVAATHNNIIGTFAIAQAAIEARIANFVLISSDKAVRPTSVMGATKRVCELILQGLAQQQPATRISIVRFGNVLASSGSVVPLFKEQIASGGPVTVTHPAITRYFMTISEAAELVIQAGAMGGSGEIFVLDMGEPMRIAELAERMIRLSGLRVRSEHNPTGDIAIEFTGLRPGEKLHEELVIGNMRQVTEHSRVLLDNEEAIAWSSLNLSLRRLERAIEGGGAAEVLVILRSLVDGFDVAEPATGSDQAALGHASVTEIGFRKVTAIP